MSTGGERRLIDMAREFRETGQGLPDLSKIVQRHGHAGPCGVPIAAPRPLVVWDHTVTCDRCGGDVHVTTDGRRIAGSTDRHPSHHAERDGTEVYVICGNNGATVEARIGYLYCYGSVAVDLSTEHWTTDKRWIDRLVTEGVDIP